MKQPGPSRAISVATLVVGLGILVPSIVWAFSAFSQFLTDEVFQAPGSFDVDLDEGEHLVYQRIGIRIDQAELLGSSDVRVEEISTGENIPTRIGGLGQSVTRGAVSFAGVVAFDIDRPGLYRVEIDGPSSTQVLIGRSVVDSFFDAWPALVGLLLGFLLSITGIVLWLVGATRRRDHRRRTGGAHPGPSPGVGQYSPTPPPVTTPPSGTGSSVPPPPPPSTGARRPAPDADVHGSEAATPWGD